MSYLLIQHVSRSVRKTFHQTQLELTGQRQMLSQGYLVFGFSAIFFHISI